MRKGHPLSWLAAIAALTVSNPVLFAQEQAAEQDQAGVLIAAIEYVDSVYGSPAGVATHELEVRAPDAADATVVPASVRSAVASGLEMSLQSGSFCDRPAGVRQLYSAKIDVKAGREAVVWVSSVGGSERSSFFSIREEQLKMRRDEAGTWKVEEVLTTYGATGMCQEPPH